MNKKIILIILCTVFTSVLMAQKHNIVNASIALKNENYSDAKKYIEKIINYVKINSEQTKKIIFDK